MATIAPGFAPLNPGDAVTPPALPGSNAVTRSRRPQRPVEWVYMVARANAGASTPAAASAGSLMVIRHSVRG